MSLRSRFALAFALVSVVVAGLVGVLSYRAASDRIAAEIDRSLQSTTVALANGQTEVLAAAGALGPDSGPEPGHDGTALRGGRCSDGPWPRTARSRCWAAGP